MTIEENVFQKYKPDFGKIRAYGFEEREDGFFLARAFMQGDFRAELLVGRDGTVRGRVIDMVDGEEYLPLRQENPAGFYVHAVQHNYREFLQGIAAACFVEQPFYLPQSNRLVQRIAAEFGDAPDFPWEKYPATGVFRHPATGKWYGAIIQVDREKLIPGESGRTEVLDVKAASDAIPALLERPGILPAYHMNKKHWLSLLLDESLTDDVIMGFLRESRAFGQAGKRRARPEAGEASAPAEWIIPANPKMYDVAAGFAQGDDVIDWKQRTDVRVGDTVYLYMGAPCSAILYRCEAVEVNLPPGEGGAEPRMRIRRLETYAPGRMPLARMRELGLGGVRSARHMPPNVSAALRP